MNMIKTVLLLFFSLLISCTTSAYSFGEYFDTPNDILTFSVDDVPTVQLDIVQGDLSIMVNPDANEVKIEIFVRRGVRILSGDRADEYRQSSRQRGNNISFQSYPARGGSSRGDVRVHYKVSVPQETNLEISMTNGSVTNESVNGNHRYSLTSGNISINSVRGQSQLMLTAANLSVNSFDGELMGNVNGGNIKINSFRGESRILLNGGLIDISDLRGSALAEVRGGSIQAQITEITDAIVFTVQAGSIDLRLPGHLKADLSVKSRRIEIGRGNDWITGVDQRSEDALYNLRDIVSGQIGTEEMSLKLNGGGKPLQAHANMGTVKVRFD